MTRRKKHTLKQWKYREDRKIGGRWVRWGIEKALNDQMDDDDKQTKMDDLQYTHTPSERSR